MKRLAYTLTLGIILGFLLLVTFPVQAGTSANATNSASACGLKASGPSERMDRMLDSLEEKGYDVSAIRAALESGDMETARTLLKQFLQDNPGALPVSKPNGDRMDRMLDSLEEKGYDVSAIRAALESGDTDTARTLLKQFLQDNPDALPEKPVMGDRPAPGISQAGNKGGPAVNNLAPTGNTTASRTRHYKGGITLKSTQTA